MNILQKVTIKQILTENSKEKLLHSFIHKKEQLQKEYEQLHFQLKKAEGRQSPSLKRQFELERERKKEKIEIIDFQIQQLSILPIGSELIEQEKQAIIEVNVGDNWNEMNSEKTVVIKDGIVIEIR
ncbi:hypothetical protein GJU40_00115 [Bacillus lacus]|uniref:YlqD protein n=1 Tax=Metabacillus lacus TaxID=1983721 RepID=A0A7X2IVW2_9BACI|nr:YlqD family protein [Metabacillus lacus]MRX70570.1 hypothetical protein [Metabacillus lacus]